MRMDEAKGMVVGVGLWREEEIANRRRGRGAGRFRISGVIPTAHRHSHSNTEREEPNLLLSSRTLLATISAVTVNLNSEPGLGEIGFLVLSRARYSNARITTLCETWANKSNTRQHQPRLSPQSNSTACIGLLVASKSFVNLWNLSVGVTCSFVGLRGSGLLTRTLAPLLGPATGKTGAGLGVGFSGMSNHNQATISAAKAAREEMCCWLWFGGERATVVEALGPEGRVWTMHAIKGGSTLVR